MRLVTTGARGEVLTSVVAPTTLTRAPLKVPRWLRRAASVVGEVLALAGIVLCIPVAILAIGMPIALLVRLLLWVGGAL